MSSHLGKLEEKKNQSRRKKGIQSSTISHKHFRLFRIFKTTGPVVFKGKDATNADDEPTNLNLCKLHPCIGKIVGAGFRENSGFKGIAFWD